MEAPIPKMSGLVRKNDLFSKAFIFPPCFRAPWNCRSIETQARGTHTHTYTAYTHAYIYVRRPKWFVLPLALHELLTSLKSVSALRQPCILRLLIPPLPPTVLFWTGSTAMVSPRLCSPAVPGCEGTSLHESSSPDVLWYTMLGNASCTMCCTKYGIQDERYTGYPMPYTMYFYMAYDATLHYIVL